MADVKQGGFAPARTVCARAWKLGGASADYSGAVSEQSEAIQEHFVTVTKHLRRDSIFLERSKMSPELLGAP